MTNKAICNYCLCDFHVYLRRILHIFVGHSWILLKNQEGKIAKYCTCLKWREYD